MTVRMWSCLRSFISLNHLTISDSSLSFPPSPPELPCVTKLSAERVTSQSYEGLLASLPGLRETDITIDDAERDIPQITAGLRRTEGQQLTTIRLEAPPSLPSEKKSISRETVRGLGLVIREQTKNLQCLYLAEVKCLDEEDLVELVESFTYLKASECLHLQSLDGGSFKYGRQSGVMVEKCRLSTEMTVRMWSCLRSFISLNHLTISDSSLSFPPSPPKLPSVTKLSAERVTSQSYEGLLASLPGLRDTDITVDDAERDIPQITAGLRRTEGQQLKTIRLEAPSSHPSEKKSISRETVRGLGLLIREQSENLRCLYLAEVKCLDEEDLVELVESLTYLKASDCLHLQSLDGGCFEYDRQTGVEVEKCRLSTEMTVRMWSCLRSFISLNHLAISDSSLSFPSSPPELPCVTKLSAERVTSQSYEGLLASLPGLRDIDITINDAERDIPQITTCLRRTKGQQLTTIRLKAQSSLPSEMNSVSRETVRGLGLLIKEQTKNLRCFYLTGIKCLDEEDLVELVESSTYLEASDRLHLQCLDGGSFKYGRQSDVKVEKCRLSTEMTVRMWSCLRSFISLNHLAISDSSLSFPSSPPELPSVTKLVVWRVTSQSYEGLLLSLPGLEEVDITIGDENTEDISQIQTSLRRHLAGQDLTLINPHSFTPDWNVSSMSTKSMKGLGVLITDCQAIMSGVVFGPKETVVDLFQSSTRLLSASLYEEQFSGSLNSDQDTLHTEIWRIKDCQLSTKMTVKLWSFLRSLTSLNYLYILDSSLSFPPFPPELPSVKKLSAENVTSTSYEGVLSSLPDLRLIDITIDDAERDILHITAGLRRHQAGGQQLTHIKLTASVSLPSEKKSVSRETMRGLGFLISEQTKNLRYLCLAGVESLDEEGLVDLIKCCTLVMTMSNVWFLQCGIIAGGRLESYLLDRHRPSFGDLCVAFRHDDTSLESKSFSISRID